MCEGEEVMIRNLNLSPILSRLVNISYPLSICSASDGPAFSNNACMENSCIYHHDCILSLIRTPLGQSCPHFRGCQVHKCEQTKVPCYFRQTKKCPVNSGLS